MTILVSGGADSGKSAFAERLVCELSPQSGSCLYIATMEPHGPEAAPRIAKHRQQRRGLGFQTVERYTDLAGLSVPGNAVALLEDLGNLCANELFNPRGAAARGSAAVQDNISQSGQTAETVQQAEASVLEGIAHLRTACQHLVLVTNEVFSGGGDYAGDTDLWLRLLARVNRHAAAIAEGVCEVVCGVPCWYRVPRESDEKRLPAVFREGCHFRELSANGSSVNSSV